MKRIITVLLCAVFALLISVPASAAGEFVIDDQAGLLTEGQQGKLSFDYREITEYFDAAFVTTDNVPGSTDDYAESYAIQRYGNAPAVIFLIDMDNRNIYVYANGSALDVVSRADARAITDNIYLYASRGDYYGCANAAFSQILARCQGQELARPVKHITNAMIALLFGILINYLIVSHSRRKNGRSSKKAGSVARRATVMPDLTVYEPALIRSERHYKSDDSGGGGRSGGGGGGGGGHSGGGGGHSF